MTLDELSSHNESMKEEICKYMGVDPDKGLGIKCVGAHVLVRLYDNSEEESNIIVPDNNLLLPENTKTLKGSKIILTESSIKTIAFSSCTGRVLDMGPECFIGSQFISGPRFKVGDYVVVFYGDGPRPVVRNKVCQILYEDRVKCVVDDPSYVTMT